MRLASGRRSGVRFGGQSARADHSTKARSGHAVRRSRRLRRSANRRSSCCRAGVEARGVGPSRPLCPGRGPRASYPPVRADRQAAAGAFWTRGGPPGRACWRGGPLRGFRAVRCLRVCFFGSRGLCAAVRPCLRALRCGPLDYLCLFVCWAGRPRSFVGSAGGQGAFILDVFMRVGHRSLPGTCTHAIHPVGRTGKLWSGCVPG